jgi:hypothetical protein
MYKTNKHQKIPPNRRNVVSIYLSKSRPATVINGWVPNHRFKATFQDILYVEDSCYNFDNSKKEFHGFFKYLEGKLLKEFSDMINHLHFTGNNNMIWNWFEKATVDWRRLALVRDYHDYRCGRDTTHHIRTYACRRFVSDIMYGMNNRYVFSKYVDMILSGTTCPRQFVHPAFKIFNPS